MRGERSFSRRGSMQLSIEAIIVLVIAMVLLGLGIAFIKGFFDDAGDAVREAFVVTEELRQLGCNPNADDPIKVVPIDLKVKSGDSLPITVCVYSSTTAANALVSIESCVDRSATGKRPQVLAAMATISGGEAFAYPVTLYAIEQPAAAGGTAERLAPGEYICTLTAVKDATGTPSVIASKQVPITVTS